MITPAEADKLIAAAIAPTATEDCPLRQAQGRVLRQDLKADRDLPPYDRVMLDGYALRAAAVEQGIRRFRVQGVQAAGMVAQKLGEEPDVCVEIMTGAVRPEGADAVVPYEDTHRGRGEAWMTISEAAARAIEVGRALHARGSDHHKGSVIVPAGTRLSGREIAVAAACGYESLQVSGLPHLAVVATGDELVEIGMPVAPHLVRCSNDYSLRAALIGAGYPSVERFHFRDRREDIEHQLWHILAEFDAVLLTGGVSKGKFDYLPEVLESLQVKRVLHRVAQRPGKPMWFGIGGRQQPVFALPGNPVSAYLCLQRYVLPALARSAGAPLPPPRPLRLASPVSFSPALTYFLPVQLAVEPDGTWLGRPDPVNTSGDFAGLIGTEGFLELPPDREEFPAGFAAPFRPWL